MRIRDWSSDVCSSDLMTGETQIYVSSPTTRPVRGLGFPYQDVRAWLAVGCNASREWAYVGFTEAPNLTDTEAKRGGYSTFAARIKWGDKLEIVKMTQRWGERFLHFRDYDRAISRMLSSPDVLLELEWSGAGAAYFRFDLSGAESVIRNARLRCSAASMQSRKSTRLNSSH